MQAECIDILTELESWFARGNGDYLLGETRRALKDSLSTSFGYHILQLGIRNGRPLCLESPINHRIHCADRSGERIGLIAQPEELPLDSDSIDTVVAHHCLEFALNPHQVLREIQRVLTPHGRLLVVGFNPYSLLGCQTRLRAMMGHSLWSQHQPVSEHRLRDWLHLLGFEVFASSRLYGLPPVGGGRVRQWISHGDAWMAQHNLPVGGVYILHATKQVAGLHRPHRALRRRGTLIGLVPKPAPTPTPTPSVPSRKSYKPPNKKDVAS
jgi:SAM-dependent methyltransferase